MREPVALHLSTLVSYWQRLSLVDQLIHVNLGLEALYKKYKDRGFVILGFPCNQFGGQEPGTDEQISEVGALGIFI